MTVHPKEEKKSRIQQGNPYELVLINDDIHSFEFVIEKLIMHCNHSPEQAEQSALITHHKGECSVLLGSEEKIETAAKNLANEGLMVDVRRVKV